MKNSIFVDELKERAKNIKINNNLKENVVLESYSNVLKYNNAFITIACIVLGGLSFCLMGCFLESNIKNGTWYIKSLFEIILAGIAVNVILWGIKSLVTYLLWNNIVKKEGDIVNPFLFFTVEGMSDIVFFIALPIFFIFYLFNNYLSILVIGGAVLTKYLIMYISYPKLLHCSNTDRLIFIVGSITTLIIIKTIISIFL